MAYAIHVMIARWRERGMGVEVVRGIRRGIRLGIDRDCIVIPHLDLTRMPREYQDYLRDFPVVVNRRVVDISKRKISRNLIGSPEEHDGAVMVKTDLNVGGEAEAEKLRRRGKLGRLMFAAARRLPWAYTGMLGSFGYRIYENTKLVPRTVWRNRRLVVEKFLPERRGELYCLRQYTFFGSREINTLAMSPDPIVKAQRVVAREVLPEAPAELRQMRRALGFDYGKFDYTMCEGRVVLFDANRTPTYNAGSKAGSPSKLILDLALGIDDFLVCA